MVSYRENGTWNITKRGNCDGIRKTTARDDRIIINAVKTDPFINSKEVAGMVAEMISRRSDASMVRRQLIGKKLKARHQEVKPLLTEAAIYKRVRWPVCKAPAVPPLLSLLYQKIGAPFSILYGMGVLLCRRSGMFVLSP
ncbi:uncharacterized protein TRIADDRAFT_62458 [Trichoplax adhaerens]|uniref:Transposase Tc1-like domain-containing protein n=1 Tax=Trichoplax adhaerens TaxID=10228 RepID=B3SDV1_TRIAD|nr:hypothetical protein TRIADDRAFT_62458 [Trichoplax adhaerens]EDV19095.1 hypothetical protein TRIADDRAFT_62458 [Trichoplax adhaerens]|eukprot:XP_002118418.1 hypothetical protein TRIADDRAFT_62458 [Trichoplax adhaerens]